MLQTTNHKPPKKYMHLKNHISLTEIKTITNKSNSKIKQNLTHLRPTSSKS